MKNLKLNSRVIRSEASFKNYIEDMHSIGISENESIMLFLDLYKYSGLSFNLVSFFKRDGKMFDRLIDNKKENLNFMFSVCNAAEIKHVDISKETHEKLLSYLYENELNKERFCFELSLINQNLTVFYDSKNLISDLLEVANKIKL